MNKPLSTDAINLERQPEPEAEHWNGKILKVHRSKGQNVSEVSLNREARQYLEAYLA